MLGFPTVIVVSVLLLRKKSVVISTPLAVLCVEFIAYADIAGITKSEMAVKTDVSDALIGGILIIAISALLQLLITRLNESADEARKNEMAQIEANTALLSMKETLENRILERTKDLTETTIISERRATNFEAAAQLARTVANIREINKLLPTITDVISERFNYYHVGIFLNDNEQEYTILVAANSDIGKDQLVSGYLFKINQQGLVPVVARTGNLRLSVDKPSEGGEFRIPEYPLTRSELALPMKIGNTMLGVIDIHSQESNAFDDTAVGILSILADQVAIAIQNARIYNETQATLAESQILYGSVIQQSWKTNLRTDTHLGYRYSGTTPTVLDKPLATPEIVQAMESGQIASSDVAINKNSNVIAVPLKLRGEVIGVIHVKMPIDTELGGDEADIVRSTAERVALALENSTLLEESQRRASREQTISQISAKIGAGTEIETILKTAVRELGQQIGGAQVSVEIGSENE
jgi:GAF domain-containing protein